MLQKRETKHCGKFYCRAYDSYSSSSFSCRPSHLFLFFKNIFGACEEEKGKENEMDG